VAQLDQVLQETEGHVIVAIRGADGDKILNLAAGVQKKLKAAKKVSAEMVVLNVDMTVEGLYDVGAVFEACGRH